MRRFAGRSTLERQFAGHHDVLAALRSLRRSPGFVAIAVLSLGLAVGLNTTTFAMLDALRNPYVPYRQPDALIDVIGANVARDRTVVARDMYLAMRDRHDLYAEATPILWQMPVIEADGKLEQVRVTSVGRGFFDVLDTRPMAGRVFRANADTSRDGDAAVISGRLWREAFAENPDLGRLKLVIAGVPHTVIGVMPATVNFPGGTDVWLSMPEDSVLAQNHVFAIEALLRLKPGITALRAKAQLDQLAARFAHQTGQKRSLFDYRVTSLKPEALPLRAFDFALGGVSLLVLLVACFNLANLMLARGLARGREIAVRKAVGANGAAIMRYVLAECGVLSVLGASWGIMLSLWGVSLTERFMPSQLAAFGFVAPHLSWRPVAFGIAATTATVFLIGLVPALRARRTDVNDAMKDGGSTSTGHAGRSYGALVITEVALSLVVLMAAGLLIRTAHWAATGKYWSYDVDHMLVANVAPDSASCVHGGAAMMLSEIAAHVSTVAGVRSVAASYWKRAPGGAVTSDAPGPTIWRNTPGYKIVSPGYSRTFGIGITEGRDFSPGDVVGPGVAIIDKVGAARLWPLQSPIGRMLKLGSASSNAPWVKIVGVTGSVNDLAKPDAAFAQPGVTVVMPSTCRGAVVYARVNGTDRMTPAAIYHALVAALPGGFVSTVRSPRTEYERTLQTRDLIAVLFSLIAVFSLALTTVGVYGVLSYTVGLRIREFAMRIALGAQTGDVFEIVWHDALVMILAGIAIGAFGALCFGYLLRHNLPEQIAPTDVISLVGAEVVLLAAGLGACIAPVRRAMRADPVALLRAI